MLNCRRWTDSESVGVFRAISGESRDSEAVDDSQWPSSVMNGARLFSTVARASRRGIKPLSAFRAPRLQDRSFNTSGLLRNAMTTPAQLASIDLAGYDPEQSRLMDERCILVDEEDRPLGAADKKTCGC